MSKNFYGINSLTRPGVLALLYEDKYPTLRGCILQCQQPLVLPGSFSHNGRIGVTLAVRPVDSLQGII